MGWCDSFFSARGYFPIRPEVVRGEARTRNIHLVILRRRVNSRQDVARGDKENEPGWQIVGVWCSDWLGLHYAQETPTSFSWKKDIISFGLHGTKYNGLDAISLSGRRANCSLEQCSLDAIIY